jgi:hypothetical protein
MILNISNPANPQYLSHDNIYSRNIAVSGNNAYMSNSNGLKILDISNPINPIEIGEYLGFDANGIFYLNNIIYIGHRYSGLKIINVTDPASLILEGEYLDGPNQVYTDIFVSDNICYIADYQGHNIKIIDVSDVSNPLLLNQTYFTSPNGGPNEVFTIGDITFVSVYDGGLKILNISDPTSPILINTYNEGGYYSGVYVSDDIAYLSNYYQGISVLNVTNPYSPKLLGNYNTGNTTSPYDVFYYENILYSGYGNDGVKILDPGFDTDEDGMPDAWETINNLNYLDPSDALEDMDGDGLLNLEELTEGTDVNDNDSDGDGLFDGEEVHYYFTDPNDVDSDDDGINDGNDDFPNDTDNDGLTNNEEISIYETDPDDDDSDDDSLSDGLEIRLETDPNDWDSDGDGIGDGLEFIADFGGESSGQALLDGFIKMTIQWESNFIIITTNSTMLSASFDQSKEELTFKVKGPSNTFSMCNVTFPTSLVEDLEKIKIKLDGKQLSFDIQQDANMVYLSFLYTHSEHDLIVGLNENSTINGFPIIFIFIALVSIIIIKTKRREDLIVG